MNKFLTVAIASLALASATAARADIVQDSWTGTFQINFYEPIGQSFQAVDAQIKAIGFQLSAINPNFPNNDPLKLDLYAGEGTGGALLATRTMQIANIANPFGTYSEFDLSGVTLTVGQTYSAVLSVVGASPYLGVQLSSVNPYASGRAFSPNFAANDTCGAAECDLRFRVLGAAAVPEPATWAMLLFGFGLAGSVARRSARTLRAA